MAQFLSNKYGNGSDGALTISENTTEAPIDSSCSGSADSTELSATNASFEADQIILIHQSRGTGAGQWELNVIASYTAGTITTKYDLAYTYTDSGASQAQVRVLKQYSDVTIDESVTYTAKAWDGNVGGILAFLCNGTTTITGTINSNGGRVTTTTGIGFIGGQRETNKLEPSCGEGTVGYKVDNKTTANGNGGGCGTRDSDNNVGGGGGNGTVGATGSGSGGAGGTTAGSADLTTMVFGGGSGGNSDAEGGYLPGIGGNGAGIVAIFSKNLVISGNITSNGGDGFTQDAGGSSSGSGGSGGAGGSILIKGNDLILGSSLITAAAGSPSSGEHGKPNGASGGVGRVAIHYGTSYSGDSTPSADFTQDSDLVPSADASAFLAQFIGK
jgi:hypothetical protein